MLTVSLEGHTNSSYPTEYTWNLGDPAATVLHGQNVTFTYPESGTYPVALTTVDSSNCTSTYTKMVEVTNAVSLYGFVHAGDVLADHGYVELIRVDPANVLTVVDTQELGDSLGWYHFENVALGHYYLKATLNPASAYYALFTPTYHNDALNWTNAQLVELGVPQSPYDIHLRHIIAYSPGPGNISGTITQQAKLNGNGATASDVEVLLLNESNQPVGVTTTDANGRFTFANVALGSYIVYPEILGKTTTPANITLSATNLTPLLTFTINSASVIYGINDLAAKYFSSISEIIPNPVSDVASLIIQAKNAVSINITITDVNGKIISNAPYNLSAGTNTLKLQTQPLAAGAYYLSIVVEGKTAVLRRFIKR
jgi:PKD repeat protein